MYYSAIGLLAAMILLIENQDILQKRRWAMEKAAWIVYRKFLYAVLAYYITDILWGMLESRKLALLLFADTTVYFTAMGAGVLFWARFTTSYLEEETDAGLLLVFAGRVVSGAIAVFAAVNIFVPVLFTVDGDCVYRALPMRHILLVSQILLLVLISVYAFYGLRYNAAAPQCQKRKLAVALFGLIMALFLFAQLWFPLLPFYSIAYLLGSSLLHTFVINDEKEEYRRRLNEAGKIGELKDTIASLLDNMPAMTFTKDAKTGVYLACNQAFAEYARRESPEGVIGLRAEQLFGAETARQIREDDRMALSMEEPYVFYQDVTDAEGSSRQLQMTKLKYRNISGQLCVLGMFQDVTDMARVQRENATTKEAYEKARSTGLLYGQIAQALARGYTDLYYVNMDSEEYIEYRNDKDDGTMTEVRRGWHFFEECGLWAERTVYADDRAAVVNALERKNLAAALDRDGTIVMTFRLIKEEGLRYVATKISRLRDDSRFLVFGMADVDEHMKERSAAVRAREEQTAYERLNALSGGFLCVYIVVPEDGSFRELSASDSYESFGQEKEGEDFFGSTREAARRFCHPKDLNRFLLTFTRENVMKEIESRGIFMISYRLMLEGVPTYVQLRAAMVEEKEGTRLIIGVSNIDAQMRQEEEYVKKLSRARIDANIDPLTGVKNRHAYLQAEGRLNSQIAEGRVQGFAIVILDVNDLKKVNDNIGHHAGDQLLRDATRIVREIFAGSMVFRVGGDEFAVIAQGNDYTDIEELTARMGGHNEKRCGQGAS